MTLSQTTRAKDNFSLFNCLLLSVFIFLGSKGIAQTPEIASTSKVELIQFQGNTISRRILSADTTLSLQCIADCDFQSGQLIIAPAQGSASLITLNSWRIPQNAALEILNAPLDSKIIIDKIVVRSQSGAIERVAPLLFRVIP